MKNICLFLLFLYKKVLYLYLIIIYNMKAKKYIINRLSELNEELRVHWMSEEYYANRDAKIEELELMLRYLNNHDVDKTKINTI